LLQLTPAGAGAIIGDKGYDSDAFVEAIQKQGMQPVIPPAATGLHRVIVIGLFIKSAI
jgi:hypothetical protein